MMDDDLTLGMDVAPEVEDERSGPLEKSSPVLPLNATKRVAVIGVHGIARHPAGETENAMADLLLSLPKWRGRGVDGVGDDTAGVWQPDGERSYSPFTATGIQIPLQRVRVSPVDGSKDKKSIFSLEEPTEKFAKLLKRKARKSNGAGGSESRSDGWQGTPTGNEFTSLLIGNYFGGGDGGNGGSGDAYVTTRLEGERSGTAGSDRSRTKVHIYEVLWADLAHPDSSFVGFFLSLFTLLLHLGSLSTYAINTGAAESPEAGKFRGCQRYAVRILQLALPLLKVLLLVTLLGVICAVSHMLKADEAAKAFAGGLGLLGGMILAFFGYKSTRWRLGTSPWVWSLMALLPCLLGFAVGYGLAAKEPYVAGTLLCWVCVGTPIMYFILSHYDNYRYGAQSWGWVGYISCFAAYWGLLYRAGWDVQLGTFWLTELIVAAIRVSWLSMSILAVIAVVLGSFAWRSKPAGSGERARMRAAVRTSRFALALPSVSFLLVTAALWSAMGRLADWVAGDKPFFGHEVVDHLNDGPLCWLVRLHLVPSSNDVVTFHGDYLRAILGWGLGYQIPITMGLVLLAFFLLVWWAVPSALLETYPQRDEKAPPRSSTNVQSRGLGNWLSRGLDATSAVTFLLWCSIFLVFPLFWLLGFHRVQHALELLTGLFPWLDTKLGPRWAERSMTALAHSTYVIVTSWFSLISGAALVAVVKYGSSVLETILDVDTYLRASPRDATPRAKIFERFVSTLRYVADYRDADGCGYDSVVIVAHSLGSLIAADLFRYLHEGQQDPGGPRYDAALQRYGFRIGDADADKIELKLLTMGSPIRQLLNRFFPYLYDWVRPDPDNGLNPLPSPGSTIFANPPSFLPDPEELGLAQWVNAYRSGDYVGRSLWLEEWYQRTNGQNKEDGRYDEKIERAGQISGPDRTLAVEMCIGAGAHTRYWDDTAPDVAEVLNEMI